MIVFLDVDEVLVDFIGAACRVHGVSREEMNAYRTDWDIRGPISRCLCTDPDFMTEAEFWEPIDAKGVAFWSELEKFPWADDLVRLVEEEVDEWYLVTSPSQKSHSSIGKLLWIQTNFGIEFNRLFLCHHKSLLAAPNRVLIDDRISNVTQFRANGGSAILYPTAVEYRGSSYVSENGTPIDPVGFVEKALKSLKRKSDENV